MFFAMVEGGKSPLLIIANDITEAGYIYNDIRNIAGEESVAVFPSGYKRDIKYGQVDPPSQMLRADVLERLRSSSRTLRCVVTCPEALAEKVAERKELDDKTIRIKTGEKLVMSEVVARLIDLGFDSVEYVYEPGQFARRGSILDVYSYAGELPYRIDFFDNDVDTIRT